ncbi:MAG: TetR/AcrR family transcriptional regulator [Spirochaetaceae bacterium]|nr:TetR/AcrR family transcriptional regulator [Spirochaetaceae bacterium]
MSAEPVIPDRRQRRRQETLEEVLDHAAEIMAEQGVAGLSVGEVARRMGIRPPSLYVYFSSKAALYDALFKRGAQLVLDLFRAEAESLEGLGRSLSQMLMQSAESFVGWSIENPAYSQLLFWRPVPGFTPSTEAYAPAVALVQLSHAWFAALQQQGLIRADAEVDHVQRDWTVLLSGVVSQQLSNAPGETLATGRFTAALPDLVAMFARHYGTDPHPSTAPKPTKEASRVRNR